MSTSKLKQIQKEKKNNEISDIEPDSNFKRFVLKRLQDVSGVSGTGIVASGIQFSDGTCVLKWLTTTSSIGIYHSVIEMLSIHGHSDSTKIIWLD